MHRTRWLLRLGKRDRKQLAVVHEGRVRSDRQGICEEVEVCEEEGHRVDVLTLEQLHSLVTPFLGNLWTAGADW